MMQKRRVHLALLALAIGTAAARVFTQTPENVSNVVLVTLDGARVEEVFGGMQLEILQSTLGKGQTVESSAAYRRFWAESPKERREKLMPFFWKTLMERHGSIAGNQALGSVVQLGNRHRFSYPGYAEILLGEPHDDEIKSNDPIRNPHKTVLEGMRDHLRLGPERVVTVGSWAHFNQIVEHVEGATTVNAGQETLTSIPGHELLNAMQTETSIPWSDMRHDSFTFKIAMGQMRVFHPRVLYLALGETDDWAHDGRYDRVLDAYARSDRYLEELWTWIQSQPDYRGRTHLLMTTDHGRGRTAADWRNHGENVEGAQHVWIAFASPLMSQRGEWRKHAPLSTSQIAGTLASWVGFDWSATRPRAGRPIR